MKAYTSAASISEIEYRFDEATINRVIVFIKEYLEEHPDQKFYNIEIIYNSEDNQYTLCPTFVHKERN